MFCKLRKSLPLLAMLLIAPMAMADETPLQLSQAFAQQKAAIMSDLAGGERYSEIASADQQKVVSLLSRLEARLGNVSALSQVPAHEHAAIASDQEEINTILTKARADSRIICRSERTVGTHRRVNQCLTVAQRREIRERAQHELSNGQRYDLTQPEGGI